MKQFKYGAIFGAAGGVKLSLLLSAGLTALILPVLATTPAAATARHERGEAAAAKPAQTAARPAGPLIIVVSTERQRITVWSADGKVAEAPVSTGREGFETPHGVFSVLGKEVEHFSNLYDDAPMPFMQRLTWSGVALHAGRLPGYPASHGCVRLGYNFSKQLFAITGVGTRVIVSDEDVAPRPISHPKLFTPLPSLQSAAPAPANTVAQGFMVPAQLGDAAGEAAKGGGVVLANAGQDMGTLKRTREAIAAERTAATADATAKFAAAEARARELAPQAKAAAVQAFEAMKAMRLARIAAERAGDEVRKIEMRAEAAKNELAGLARLKERVTGEAAAGKAQARELALEERLSVLADEIGKAKPAEAEARGALETATARAQRLEIDKAAAAGALHGAMEALNHAKEAAETLKREDANRARPITVLISRKTGRLQVRQGFDELFETPVSIQNAELPFGTHVFTAMEGRGADELSWSVVTVQGGQDTPVLKPRKSRRGQDEAEPVRQEATTAARALDRIGIPDAALERIAEHVKPGSSLIITDQGPSRETGKGTDFVVLTR